MRKQFLVIKVRQIVSHKFLGLHENPFKTCSTAKNHTKGRAPLGDLRMHEASTHLTRGKKLS